MIDKDMLADILANELSARIRDLDPEARGVTPVAARLIIDAIESLGYACVRTERGTLTTEDHAEVGEAIIQGIPANILDGQDIDTAAIVYALESAGWHLISPRT